MAAQPKPMTVRERQGSLVKYIYLDRYEVHVSCREEAKAVLRQFGFTDIVDSQLVTGRVSRPVPASTDFDKAKHEVEGKTK